MSGMHERDWRKCVWRNAVVELWLVVARLTLSEGYRVTIASETPLGWWTRFLMSENLVVSSGGSIEVAVGKGIGVGVSERAPQFYESVEWKSKTAAL
ncbi:hypothetical protein BU16DRAFT_241332 [Lophium mytilinum]|uniref:Uncharacterized protein n=1 Tax=Lophium mytilinum TaxID=390894 RepID=A0A6A6R941_9PEZI|nr:hypothetical protein BU16DRAFT_241332 [Lophium mytilinum]